MSQTLSRKDLRVLLFQPRLQAVVAAGCCRSHSERQVCQVARPVHWQTRACARAAGSGGSWRGRWCSRDNQHGQRRLGLAEDSSLPLCRLRYKRWTDWQLLCAVSSKSVQWCQREPTCRQKMELLSVTSPSTASLWLKQTVPATTFTSLPHPLRPSAM